MKRMPMSCSSSRGWGAAGGDAAGGRHLLREAVGVVEGVHVAVQDVTIIERGRREHARALQPVRRDDEDVDENEVVLEQLELGGGGHVRGLRKLLLEEEGGGEEEDKPESKVGIEGEDGSHGWGWGGGWGKIAAKEEA